MIKVFFVSLLSFFIIVSGAFVGCSDSKPSTVRETPAPVSFVDGADVKMSSYLPVNATVTLVYQPYDIPFVYTDAGLYYVYDAQSQNFKLRLPTIGQDKTNPDPFTAGLWTSDVLLSAFRGSGSGGSGSGSAAAVAWLVFPRGSGIFEGIGSGSVLLGQGSGSGLGKGNLSVFQSVLSGTAIKRGVVAFGSGSGSWSRSFDTSPGSPGLHFNTYLGQSLSGVDWASFLSQVIEGYNASGAITPPNTLPMASTSVTESSATTFRANFLNGANFQGLVTSAGLPLFAVTDFSEHKVTVLTPHSGDTSSPEFGGIHYRLSFSFFDQLSAIPYYDPSLSITLPTGYNSDDERYLASQLSITGLGEPTYGGFARNNQMPQYLSDDQYTYALASEYILKNANFEGGFSNASTRPIADERTDLYAVRIAVIDPVPQADKKSYKGHVVLRFPRFASGDLSKYYDPEGFYLPQAQYLPLSPGGIPPQIEGSNLVFYLVDMTLTRAVRFSIPLLTIRSQYTENPSGIVIDMATYQDGGELALNRSLVQSRTDSPVDQNGDPLILPELSQTKGVHLNHYFASTHTRNLHYDLVIADIYDWLGDVPVSAPVPFVSGAEGFLGIPSVQLPSYFKSALGEDHKQVVPDITALYFSYLRQASSLSKAIKENNVPFLEYELSNNPTNSTAVFELGGTQPSLQVVQNLQDLASLVNIPQKTLVGSTAVYAYKDLSSDALALYLGRFGDGLYRVIGTNQEKLANNSSQNYPSRTFCVETFMGSGECLVVNGKYYLSAANVNGTAYTIDSQTGAYATYTGALPTSLASPSSQDQARLTAESVVFAEAQEELNSVYDVEQLQGVFFIATGDGIYTKMNGAIKPVRSSKYVQPLKRPVRYMKRMNDHVLFVAVGDGTSSEDGIYLVRVSGSNYEVLSTDLRYANLPASLHPIPLLATSNQVFFVDAKTGITFSGGLQ